MGLEGEWVDQGSRENWSGGPESIGGGTMEVVVGLGNVGVKVGFLCGGEIIVQGLNCIEETGGN